jgi:hypothetical protein
VVTPRLRLLELVHTLEHLGLDDGHPRGVGLSARLEGEEEESKSDGDDGDEDGPGETVAEEGEGLVEVEEEGLKAHDRVRAPGAGEGGEVEGTGENRVVEVGGLAGC